MSSMESYAFAAKFRDTIVSIVQNALDASRPDYRYGVVSWIDRTNAECGVYFDNNPAAVVTVRMGSIQPKLVGQTVRVYGKIGDRFIDDVIGTAYVDPANTSPIGTVIMFASSAVAPGNWLTCDGSTVSRTTYADLFAVLGTTYGAGNGTTTFTLPNFTNKFPRGNSPGTGGGADTHLHSGITAGTPTGTVAVTGTNSNEASHTHGVFTGTASASANISSDTHSHGGAVSTPSGGGSVASGGSNVAGTSHIHAISNGTHSHSDSGHGHTLSTTSAGGSTHTHALTATGTFTGTQMSTHQHDTQNNVPAYVGVKYLIKFA